MQNRPFWFVARSARVPCVGFGVAPKQSFPIAGIACNRTGQEKKFATARRARQHPRRVRFPIPLAALLAFAPLVCLAQQPSPTPSPGEAEAQQVVVSATRFDIPLDQSPASVSVISSEDIEQKQCERVGDALREVPGLSVVQTGTAGQLTSVFIRGLRSEHTQVLLDGIPINQGLQGAFNFADLTTEDIGRIEVVRGPQSTLYGPRALAGVIQIFTKQGTGTPGVLLAAEGGSYDAFREWTQSDGKIDGFDYSMGASRLDTENARPNNNYRNTAMIADTGWSPNDQLRIGSLFTYSVSDTGNPNSIFGPQPTFVSDHTQEVAGFLQATLMPVENLILVAGGRFDHFNQFGGVWTYRFAGSYKIDKTNTTLHSSVATGFSPPSSQDKIFGNNFGLKPERDLGWDIGVRQELWSGGGRSVAVGLTYFHNDLSNVIGFNGLFQTLNLGAAETQGLEAELRAQPIADLVFNASYTYLDAEKTSSAEISQPQGARLPRRPRNEIYVSGSYLWWKRLRTVVEAKFVNAREELKFGGPNFDIEDYSFVNFAAEYEVNPHLSLFGRIDNLTNEHYAEVFGFPALGRAAYGGAKLRF